jgi:hypothetical protein
MWCGVDPLVVSEVVVRNRECAEEEIKENKKGQKGGKRKEGEIRKGRKREK